MLGAAWKTLVAVMFSQADGMELSCSLKGEAARHLMEAPSNLRFVKEVLRNNNGFWC